MKKMELFENFLHVRNSLDDTSKTDIEKIYSAYVINKLSDSITTIAYENPEEELNLNAANSLATLLKEFFEKSCKTDMVLPNTPYSKVNQILLFIAQTIAPILGKSQYEILFPHLKVLDYPCSGTNLTQDTIAIYEFILSDDETEMIEIFPTLDFAIEDGLLKRNSLNENRLLTESEKYRVVNHSKEAREYWNAIQEKVTIETAGESFGAAINRLANGLISGSIKGSGTEFICGAEANVAIKNFYEWFEKLSNEEKKWLSKYGAHALSDDFGTLWKRLCNPVNPDTNFLYCVQLTGGCMQTILKNNPDLFNIFPINKQCSQVSIQQVREVIKTKKTALLQAIKLNKLKVLSSYGPDNMQKIYQTLLTSLDIHKYADQNLLEAFTKEKRLAFLENLLPENRIVFLENISQLIAASVFHWTDAKAILKLIPNAHHIRSLSVFLPHFLLWIQSAEQLEKIANYFSPNTKSALLELLVEYNPDLLSDAKSLTYILLNTNGKTFKNLISNHNDRISKCIKAHWLFYKLETVLDPDRLQYLSAVASSQKANTQMFFPANNNLADADFCDEQDEQKTVLSF